MAIRAPRAYTSPVPTIRSLAVAALGASLALAPITPLTAAAQAAPADSAPRIHVLTARDAAVTGALALTAAALMPSADQHIAHWMQQPSRQSNDLAKNAATVVRDVGGPGTIVFGGATYVLGRIDQSPRLQELGLRTLESIAAGSAVGFVIKGAVGRARPYAVGDSLPHDFHAGRGYHDDRYTSFPSGHTIAAFATASAASQEIHYLWPHSSPLITPALYTGATLVGLSRLYNDDHWASDVAAGAAVGTLAARVVVRYQRAHPGNVVDRWLLPTSVVPAGHGAVALTWDRTW
jgi:membrane-associated phospholipid phosphatase